MGSLARITARTCQALVALAVALGAAACVTNAVDVNEKAIKLPERQDSELGDDDAGIADDPGSQATVPTTQSTPASEDDAGAGTPAVDAAPPPPKAAWFQANGQDCVAFCAGRGGTNVASPEGAKCTSGENIPQSAITAMITYDKCFPNCNAHLAGSNVKSVGNRCYADGQKHDDDGSDTTRGCFCQ